VLAQAIGRWGNWFNNELYGSPTNLPWGLQIHQWDAGSGHAIVGADGRAVVLGTFQPTFLYESLWDAATAVVLIFLDRRLRLGHGRVFAFYVLLYTVGRGWIEALRVDPANHILGLRLNLWTSLFVGLGALVYLVVSFRLRPGREEFVFRDHRDAEESEDDVASPAMTRWMAWVRTRPNRRGDSDTEGDTEDDSAGNAGDDTEDDTADRGEAGDDARTDTPGDRLDGASGDASGERAGAAKAGGSGDAGTPDTLP
jgi:hypothetical protein